MIVVLQPGALTTVQDLGRPGLAYLGVGRSGAVDRPSLQLANRLVGNAESCACLELTFGGLRVRVERAATIALTGAPVPLRVAERLHPMNGPVFVRAGDVVDIGLPERGVRSYLAVRGGIAVDPVLESRSTDMLAALGPPPLDEETRLPIGDTAESEPTVDVAPVASLPEDVVLSALPGPRDDWFTPEALAALASEPYEVTPNSDRVGVRLRGPALERSRAGELPSEGVVEGALQVSSDGQPVLFLADHPVTGGYPVIAVVEPSDIAVAAQLRPGEQVRFRLVR